MVFPTLFKSKWSNVFPYFLQFKSKFVNQMFMIWATVSSQSCFYWLYSATPSLVAKNIINPDTDHLEMSMCRVFSCAIGRGCLLWPVHSLGKTLLAFAFLWWLVNKAPLQVLAGHLQVFFGKIFTQILCPFLIRSLVVLFAVEL